MMHNFKMLGAAMCQAFFPSSPLESHNCSDKSAWLTHKPFSRYNTAICGRIYLVNIF